MMGDEVGTEAGTVDGTSPPRDPRAPAHWPLWLVLAGLLLRLVYITEHAGSAFFDVPLLDEKYYDTVARALLEGDGGQRLATINPGFRPLLYPLLLAGAYVVAGDWGRILTIAGQHLLGVATAVGLAFFAARLFRRRAAGWLAGGLYLLAGPPLYFEGELLITALFTALGVGQLVLLARFGDRAWGWLAAGAWTALMAQARPNALVFLAAYPAVALLASGLDWRTRLLRPSLALTGALVVLAGFAAAQAPLLGHGHLAGGSGGVNFYLGNKRGADGMIPRQDRPITYGDEYRDSVQVFAAEVYRESTDDPEATPGEVSRFWLARAVDEIVADPAAWLGLLGRKILYLVADREIPNNKNYAFVVAHESALLALLPVRFALLFAFVPLGVVMAWRYGDRDLLRWLLLFLGLFAAGIVLFFVNSRFRIPLWPGLAILAAGGILALVDAARSRRFRGLAVGFLSLILAGGLSLVAGAAVPETSFARDFFFRSIAGLEKARLDDAAEDARRAVELEPGDAAHHFQLATAELLRDRPAAALSSFEEAARRKPGEPRIWNNLGVTLERLARPGDAYAAYLRAIELEPTYPPPWSNAALLEIRAGWLDRAATALDRAAGLGETSLPYHVARGLLARARGRGDEAHDALAEAERLDADTAARLIEESTVTLPAEDLETMAKARREDRIRPHARP